MLTKDKGSVILKCAYWHGYFNAAAVTELALQPEPILFFQSLSIS